MNYRKKITTALLAILITGLLTLPLTLVSPSEGESAFWMGISKGRLAIFVVQMLIVLIAAIVLVLGTKRNYHSTSFQRLEKFLTNQANYTTLRYVLFGVSVFLSFAFVNFSILIPQALSALSGWLAFSAWILYALFIKLVQAPADFVPVKFSTLFPSWNNLTKTQKRTTLVLLGLGLLYFCLFIPLNLKSSGSRSELNLDEMLMLPHVEQMLSAQPNLHTALYRFLVYGDYIYGFLFYGFSALLLLPLKLMYGPSYADHLQLVMLLLRQFANVLPAVLACFIVTWLATHFKKFWASLIVFIILLTLPGMTGINNTFWHPDAINLLFIVLTLYYLDRDQFKFGPNFYFAAITCGASIATRLFGVFFFLTIGLLLAAGMIKKVLSPRKAIVTGLLFIVLMGGAILVSNPYTFSPGELGAVKATFEHRQSVLASGINEPDPEHIYRTGIDAWWPFFTRNYGSGVTLVFLSVSTAIGALGKKRKAFYGVLFAWLLVIGTYLIGFVLVKSPWYILPFLIPLYCAAMAIPENLDDVFAKLGSSNARLASIGVLVLMGALGIIQIVQNLRILVPVFLAI
ncbi:MAG: hypothetical protein C0410_02615 [Anaerolinea sp.]|nr:hypothetical protein [Anaerolinea sp.]